ncbi:non-reducing end alpha-L-arabinofuranosidase family hydrolase [Prosthecobacter sp.]|uniref:non-reducing end alpha-L-arabinofuranosidase family hydrolase n=1 Tax=Prosthecobacter sp. TaxID=1965333 RepID=UPI003784AC1D
MKLSAIFALCLIGTLHAADPAWLGTGEFQWESTPPLIGPATDAADPDVALKDPTMVFHEGKWHLFATHRRASGKVDMQYLSFADWKDAGKATRHTLDFHDQYHCAPQVFYFTPHQKWYLIYQLADERRAPKMGPFFSTTSTLGDPKSWTKPQPMIDTLPEGGDKIRWIDFWVICDATKAHLFYTSDDGHFWRRETTKASFPLGWSKPELLLKDTKDELFEASHTYKLKGREQYLTLIEAMAPGQRYYKAWLANKLEGPWKPLAATREHPFASAANVSQRWTWTTSISHGELIRSENDEMLEVDPANLRFVFQGVDDEGYKAKKYGSIPWRIGILDFQPSATEQALNRTIFPKLLFENEDVGDAVSYLGIKCRDMHTAAGEQMGGVNLVVRCDDKATAAKISLNAENISFRDALEEVARQSGLRLTIFRHRVMLAPKADKISEDPFRSRP